MPAAMTGMTNCLSATKAVLAAIEERRQTFGSSLQSERADCSDD
jgi:hypothetical protein